MRVLLVLILVFATFTMVRAQEPITKKPIDSPSAQIDTLKPPAYVNQGKIAGRKAFHRSLIFPGLGQIYNYGLVVKDVQSGAVKGNKVAQKLYILGKLGAIYAGGTMLVISYSDNRQQYKRFLTELQYRQENKGAPDPNGDLTQYSNTEALTVAKNIYKRNSQIVLISLVGMYGLSALDAYVTARLKYFNIDTSLAFKVSPSVINSNSMYGFNAVPALKFTLKL
jgi:hypothetical protein